MKKGILITIFVLMAVVAVNAQSKWVEKSVDGDNVEKEMILFKQGPGPRFNNDCSGYGQHGGNGMRGHGQRGGQGMCDGHGPQGRHGGNFGQGMFPLLRHAEMLDLTDKQIDQIKELKYQFNLEKIDRKAAIEKAQLKLSKMMRDDVSESKVFSAIDKASELRAEMKKMQYKHHAEIKNLLTDEQKEKMKELRNGSFVTKGKNGMKKFGNKRPF